VHRCCNPGSDATGGRSRGQCLLHIRQIPDRVRQNDVVKGSLDREGLRDNIDGHISFIDLLYFTMITVTTVGYGDIVPVTNSARLFDTFVVTPIRLFVWLIFLGTAYDFLLRRTWYRWRMKVIQRRLTGHVVIAGYGTSGTEALRELQRRGCDPANIVVIDRDERALADAEQCGAVVLDGDATRDKTLEIAHVAQASTLMVSAGRDDTTILIVLTARRLSENVRISAVVRSDDNEPLARQAGAARLARDNIETEIAAGEKTMTDLLQADETWLESQVEEITARQAYLAADIELMRLTGALMPAALGIAAEDPDEYLDRVRHRTLSTRID
jgi:voltage-gated potassium channel Kch